MHPRVQVAEQPITTPSTSEAVQQPLIAPTVQPPVALTTPKQHAPSRRHLHLQMYNHQMAELLLHLTDVCVTHSHLANDPQQQPLTHYLVKARWSGQLTGFI